MNDRPGRDPSERRRRRRNPGDPARQPGDAERPETTVEMRGTQALERLRDRINTATEELLRLREENATLAERIARLEARAGGDLEEGTLLHLGEDPETLRRKINGFIEAIDLYLQSDQT